MNIELRKTSKLKTLISRCSSKAEDILFSVLLKVPSELLPNFVGPHLDTYIENRIRQLQLETTKSAWKSIQLESALKEIKEKAPLDE